MQHVALNSQQIAEELKKMPEWHLENGCLSQEFTFNNFPEAFAFMTRVALIAQKINHHPTFFNDFKKVRLELWTFDAGSITENDIELAKEIRAMV